MQRSDSYEASSEDGGQQKQFPVKKPLLPTRHSPQSHQADGMRGSDLSYHKHKSKQRRTLMSRQQGGEDWEGEASQDEEEGPVGKAGSNRDAMHPLPHINTRTPRDRQGKLMEEGICQWSLCVAQFYTKCMSYARTESKSTSVTNIS